MVLDSTSRMALRLQLDPLGTAVKVVQVNPSPCRIQTVAPPQGSAIDTKGIVCHTILYYTILYYTILYHTRQYYTIYYTIYYTVYCAILFYTRIGGATFLDPPGVWARSGCARSRRKPADCATQAVWPLTAQNGRPISHGQYSL